MAKHYSDVIDEIMPLVEDGDKSAPFIIYRNKEEENGPWFTAYPYPAENVKEVFMQYKENDPHAAMYFGADFDGGSLPFVYDKILCDRMRSEYFECSGDDWRSDADKKSIRALINFFEDNTGAFSHTVTNYLTDIDQPFRAFEKMCPFNMATGHEDWTFNESLAMDAVDHIENAAERLSQQLNDRNDVNEVPNPTPDKRGVDGYEELNCIRINQSEIILAENPDAEFRYKVVENRFTEYYVNSGDNNIYTGHTNDFVEALDEFTKKVQYNIDCVKSTREVHQNLYGVEPKPLTASDCLPNSHKQDFTGKLIIVKADELKPEYRVAESQLILCNHGNGARPGAIGTSVFGTELLSDKTVCYGRHQIAGIANIAKMPEWAVKKTALTEALKKPPVKEKSVQKPDLLGKISENKRKVERDKANAETPAPGKNKKRDGQEV
jgi:hypothetical protein